MEQNESKDYELPQVTSEGAAYEVGQTHQEATESVRLERSQTTQQIPLGGAVSMQPVSGLPPVANDHSQTVSAIGSTLLADDPVTADDIDLIEKAWVEKAKQVVRATLGDPYNQNKEINKMKADYIKKRYNRDIKTSD